MSKEYPLYPELPEAAQNEAQELINKFKAGLAKAAEEVIGGLYCDVAIHIESDSWTNFGNEIMEGFRNYDNRKIQGKYDFKAIRAEIFKEYRADIIKDLDQDILAENEALKYQNKQLLEQLQNRY